MSCLHFPAIGRRALPSIIPFHRCDLGLVVESIDGEHIYKPSARDEWANHSIETLCTLPYIELLVITQIYRWKPTTALYRTLRVIGTRREQHKLSMANGTGTSQTYETVRDLITGRHTFRRFQSTEIPQEILGDAFALAQLSPSNNNLQPWRAIVVRGEALTNLKKELHLAWTEGWPILPPVPDDYVYLKEAFGSSYYGKHLGIGRDDHEKRNEAIVRNFDFYGAATAIIVYQDSRLTYHDTLSVGFWMHNLTLTLRTRNIEACYMASITGYPALLKKTLGIPEAVDILSGIALGYLEEGAIENTYVIGREPWEDRVTFQS